MKLLFVTFFLFSLSSFAQNEDVIEGFTATEFNGKVLLTWSVKQGFTCNGVEILHSLDSVNFTQIGSIEGICGSTAESIAYDFTHLDPDKNVTNYYRLHLGGVGFSKIISTEVLDLAGTNYLLRPNPIVSHSELFFDNETAASYEFTVYTSQGVRVFTDQTNGELFLINRSDFNEGMYFFTINKEWEDPKITGKFLVF